jgi:hypothetical protein
MTEFIHVALKCFFKPRSREKVIANFAIAWAATVYLADKFPVP